HQTYPGKVASQIISANHGDNVRDDQSEERNVSYDRSNDTDGNGDERIGQKNKLIIIDSQGLCDVFSQSGEGQSVRIQKNNNRHENNNPKILIPPDLHTGKRTDKPVLNDLRHVK